MIVWFTTRNAEGQLAGQGHGPIPKVLSSLKP